MAELKTKENRASVEDFLHGSADGKVRHNCLGISDLMP